MRHANDSTQAHPPVLLRRVELDGKRCDVRLAEGRLQQVAPTLRPGPEDILFDADGGALLPGLHDHHLHLHALAARTRSIPCGPPAVMSLDALHAALRAAAPGDDGWLRGIDYHESVAGELTRVQLDPLVGHLPLRLQHRGGKLWMLNTVAIERICLQQWATLAGVERDADGRVTGRLFRLDDWLQARLRASGDAGEFPQLDAVSAALARCGVTGVTDASAHNGSQHLQAFVHAVDEGQLRQRLLVMGTLSLPPLQHPRISRGAFKVLLDDDALPDIDVLAARIDAAHAQGRGVAFHCVTRVELLFALAALAQARTRAGSAMPDRIEHAGIVPDDALPLLAASAAQVVTQPNFITERGDRYRVDVEPGEQPLLYRLASLQAAGIPVGGGSDAPYGLPDPWAAMQAAVTRRCASGATLGPLEGVSPERALALFTSSPAHPGGTGRRLHAGAVADLCLLDRPWQAARTALDARHVAATFVAGVPVYQRDRR